MLRQPQRRRRAKRITTRQKPSVHDNPTSESSTQHSATIISATRATAANHNPRNHVPTLAKSTFFLDASDSSTKLRSLPVRLLQGLSCFSCSPKARPCANGVMLSDFSTAAPDGEMINKESVRWPTFRFRMLDKYRPLGAKLHTPDLYLNLMIWPGPVLSPAFPRETPKPAHRPFGPFLLHPAYVPHSSHTKHPLPTPSSTTRIHPCNPSPTPSSHASAPSP